MCLRASSVFLGRFYLKGLYDRTHHVHAFNRGTTDVFRHLAFKDYLIAHPDIAGEYGATKAKLADMCNNDNDTYCDGKTGFVQEHEKKALRGRLANKAIQRTALRSATDLRRSR